MKKLNLDEMKTVVMSVLLMIVGILFCCSLAMGIEGLSVVIGLVLMVVGIIFIANSLLGEKNPFTIDGMMGIVLLSLGILFMVSKLAGLIFIYIPWFLIVFGCVMLIDALLGKLVRKSDDTLHFVLKLVVGVVSIVLGLCLRLIDGFAEYASLVLGILMIAFAIYLLIDVFIRKK